MNCVISASHSRISASSLQRTQHYENKLDELRQELTVTRLSASDALVNKACWEEKQVALKARLDKTAQELDRMRTEGRAKTGALQVRC